MARGRVQRTDDNSSGVATLITHARGRHLNDLRSRRQRLIVCHRPKKGVMVRALRWRLAARTTAVLGAVFVLIGLAGALASAQADPVGARAYELVSPADKNGGDILAYSPRTRASADGNAVGFASLIPFGDPRGTGTAVEYLAERTSEAWLTHAITPLVPANSLKGLLAGGDAMYDGSFSPDFNRAIFTSIRPLTSDSGVEDVGNLYRRTDLRTAGRGMYELMSACPACEATGAPLPPLADTPSVAAWFLPVLAGASPDMEHVIFESLESLTTDAPAQPPLCGTAGFFFPFPSAVNCRPRLYEWDRGQVRLVGILPDGAPADVSFAGTGIRNATLTPHTISDRSDGHTRIIFTQPTDVNGVTASQADPLDAGTQIGINFSESGNLFMRIDEAATVQLNRSERSSADAFAPAQYLDASADGRRVFFMTSQALTNDSQVSGMKIYMYDASKPDSAPDNLTLLTPADPQAGVDAVGMLGASDDGHYAYIVVTGNLIRGTSVPGAESYLWHDGAIQDVGPSPDGTALFENLTDGVTFYGRQARVTSDGRHLLFTTLSGAGLGGYDQTACVTNVGPGCREVYVYSADTGRVACASCNPSGAPATVMATVVAEDVHGGARITSYQNHPLSSDGRYVFFNTAEALVPEDTNGRVDAYEFDVQTSTISLISTGKDSSDSWFLDASADGHDVFFVTRQRLVAWDRDDAYDLYDARIGGGLPEPPRIGLACTAGTCQGPLSAPPSDVAPASSQFTGPGNVRARLRTRARHRCKPGTVKRHRRGKTQCIKRRKRPRQHPRRSS